MSPLRPTDLLDDAFEDDPPRPDAALPDLNAPRSVTASAPRQKKRTDHMVRDEILRHTYQELVTQQMGTEGLFNPTFTSSSDGFAPSGRSAMIIPGVQMPHCAPISFMNAICSG